MAALQTAKGSIAYCKDAPEQIHKHGQRCEPARCKGKGSTQTGKPAETKHTDDRSLAHLDQESDLA